jgi:dihydrofolate synthase/folylpolyglutamate synthase
VKPFTSLEEALPILYLRTSTSTFGLKAFKQCMSDLGNPQEHLNVVHVAGTNGKGSVSNYISTSLETAGCKVGLYTSPFLITHNDRFRLNHVPIEDKRLLFYINKSIPYWETYHLSMFEIDTLLAIWYFLDEQVDWAIMEVGLGGRLDATNVVFPKVCVITTIGYDHMDLLGDTLEEIAFEKAGIIKEGIPVVTFNKSKEVFEVIRSIAKEKHAPIIITKPTKLVEEQLFSQTFMYDNHKITLASGASYQRLNAALAFESLRLIQRFENRLELTHILEGLKQAKWPGRFDAISVDPLIVVDGAHNQEGIEALVENFSRLPRPIVVVFAALKDKPTKNMLAKLDEYADIIIVSQFNFYRADTAKNLAYQENYKVIEDYKAALKQAKLLAKAGTIMVCGSLYFISEVYNTIVVNK